MALVALREQFSVTLQGALQATPQAVAEILQKHQAWWNIAKRQERGLSFRLF